MIRLTRSKFVTPLILLSLIYIYICFYVLQPSPITDDVGMVRIESNSSVKSPEKLKTILFMGQWYVKAWEKNSPEAPPLLEQRCQTWQCEITYNRERFNDADAVIFKYFNLNELFTHSRPSAAQRWVLLDREAPSSKISRGIFDFLRTHKASHFINWTMSHNSEADVHISYGALLPKFALRPHNAAFLDYSSPHMNRHQNNLASKKSLREVLGTHESWKFGVKPRLIAWMSSHCPVNSAREDFVRELSRHVRVDTFGSCGVMKCTPDRRSSSECWEGVLATNYSFYLSMESNFCKDYVTEKLYLPLKYGLVPVVYGGADYSTILPPNSYIDARQYTPKQLANLLVSLKNNPLQYERYHLWRSEWSVDNGGHLCDLCHKLYTDAGVKSYDDIPTYVESVSKCNNPKKVDE